MGILNYFRYSWYPGVNNNNNLENTYIQGGPPLSPNTEQDLRTFHVQGSNEPPRRLGLGFWRKWTFWILFLSLLAFFISLILFAALSRGIRSGNSSSVAFKDCSSGDEDCNPITKSIYHLDYLTRTANSNDSNLDDVEAASTKSLDESLNDVEATEFLDKFLEDVEATEFLDESLNDVEATEFLDESLNDVEATESLDESLNDVEAKEFQDKFLQDVEAAESLDESLNDVKAKEFQDKFLEDVEATESLDMSLDDVEIAESLYKSCTIDQFKCPISGICIQKNEICDHFRDCSDGEDEKNCITLSKSAYELDYDDASIPTEGYLLTRVKGTWHPYCNGNWSKALGTKICQYLGHIGLSDIKTLDLLNYTIEKIGDDPGTKTGKVRLEKVQLIEVNNQDELNRLHTTNFSSIIEYQLGSSSWGSICQIGYLICV